MEYDFAEATSVLKVTEDIFHLKILFKYEVAVAVAVAMNPPLLRSRALATWCCDRRQQVAGTLDSRVRGTWCCPAVVVVVGVLVAVVLRCWYCYHYCYS